MAKVTYEEPILYLDVDDTHRKSKLMQIKFNPDAEEMIQREPVCRVPDELYEDWIIVKRVVYMFSNVQLYRFWPFVD